MKTSLRIQITSVMLLALIALNAVNVDAETTTKRPTPGPEIRGPDIKACGAGELLVALDSVCSVLLQKDTGGMARYGLEDRPYGHRRSRRFRRGEYSKCHSRSTVPLSCYFCIQSTFSYKTINISLYNSCSTHAHGM